MDATDRADARSRRQRRSGRPGYGLRSVSLADFDRVPLLFGPSPVHRLERLGEHLGGRVEIWAAASDHPLGGLGFARWADEVAQQERELGVFFDTVVVCSVTGSTQAGMVAGFAAQERARNVLGIDGSATVPRTWEQIARIA